MRKSTITAFTFLSLNAQLAISQTTSPVTTESRDAATAYIGTANFVVGRVGRDCLSVAGRNETPKEFVGAWQQRNMKYLAATQKYMEARFGEAERNGGVEKRDAVMRELATAVRASAESTVKSWIERPEKQEACKRALAIIESGAYDFSPKMPMYPELESLATWAAQQ